MQPVQRDDAGPTAERIHHAGQFYTIAGRSKSNRRITMFDDALGRAWMRQKISDEEYFGLRRYAHHWLAGALQSPMQSVDLNRIYAFDPQAMSGLAKTERAQNHRVAYYAARMRIGKRLSFVADQVACFNCSLLDVGIMLGYRSPWHGRDQARALLSEAGYRLVKFWEELRRRSAA
jgi:hypothetical protein